jgi:hypothetical protein
LDVSGFTNGVYSFSVKNKNGDMLNKKVVIQR